MIDHRIILNENASFTWEFTVSLPDFASVQNINIPIKVITLWHEILPWYFLVYLLMYSLLLFLANTMGSRSVITIILNGSLLLSSSVSFSHTCFTVQRIIVLPSSPPTPQFVILKKNSWTNCILKINVSISFKSETLEGSHIKWDPGNCDDFAMCSSMKLHAFHMAVARAMPKSTSNIIILLCGPSWKNSTYIKYHSR